jgi:hypothetical protein
MMKKRKKKKKKKKKKGNWCFNPFFSLEIKTYWLETSGLIILEYIKLFFNW